MAARTAAAVNMSMDLVMVGAAGAIAAMTLTIIAGCGIRLNKPRLMGASGNRRASWLDRRIDESALGLASIEKTYGSEDGT